MGNTQHHIQAASFMYAITNNILRALVPRFTRLFTSPENIKGKQRKSWIKDCFCTIKNYYGRVATIPKTEKRRKTGRQNFIQVFISYYKQT
jgi:hypothetical protein